MPDPVSGVMTDPVVAIVDGRRIVGIVTASDLDTSPLPNPHRTLRKR